MAKIVTIKTIGLNYTKKYYQKNGKPFSIECINNKKLTREWQKLVFGYPQFSFLNTTNGAAM